MKKELRHKKLQLSSETLRRLTNRELGRVAGGGVPDPGPSAARTDCVDCQFSGSVGGYGGGNGN